MSWARLGGGDQRCPSPRRPFSLWNRLFRTVRPTFRVRSPARVAMRSGRSRFGSGFGWGGPPDGEADDSRCQSSGPKRGFGGLCSADPKDQLGGCGKFGGHGHSGEFGEHPRCVNSVGELAGSSAVRVHAGTSSALGISDDACEATIESGAASGAVSGDTDQPETSGDLRAAVSMGDLEGRGNSGVDNPERWVD
jgi:hypothetical protein